VKLVIECASKAKLKIPIENRSMGSIIRVSLKMSKRAINPNITLIISKIRQIFKIILGFVPLITVPSIKLKGISPIAQNPI
jgi:hypothetical protein